MTRKTIQFKLPVLTTDPALSILDRNEAATWVTDLDEAIPADAIEAFAFTGPTHADNDAFAEPETALEAPEPLEPEAALPPIPSRQEGASILRGVGRMADCGIAITFGLNALSREWLTLPFEAVRRNLDGLNVLRCRSLSDLVDLHADMMRRNVEDTLARNGRIARLSMQVMAESSRALAIGLQAGDE